MQLIVMGMHRSGTSVLARLLNLMGVYFAPEGMGTGANQENPKGFWERRDVRALNDFVLHGMGCDWNRVSRFDASTIPEPLLAEFDKRASQIVLSMDANRPWFMKEPRLCLLLPLWRRVLEVPICIHVLRNPIEVASSLRTRNGIPIEAGLALWEAYNRSALEGMGGLERVVVHHRSLMQEPVAAATMLYDQLAALEVRRLALPTATEIVSFVSSELYREREGRRGLDAYAAVSQLKLFEGWSAGKALPKGDRGLAAKERDALVAYEASLPPLVVANAAAPKAPTETELREKILAGEQNARNLKEQLQHVQALLGQREKQVVFIETEFTALREAHATRDSAAVELVASLNRLLLEREVWLQEKDRGAEAERARLMKEVGRLAEKLEADRATLEFARLAVADRQQELKAHVATTEVELAALREAHAARESAASEMVAGLKELLLEREAWIQEKDRDAEAERARLMEEIARLSEEREADRAMLQAAQLATAARNALQMQVAERDHELAQLTRLYLDEKQVASRLQTSVAHAESAMIDAQEHVAAISAETNASLERHLWVEKSLSNGLAKSEHELKTSQLEAALLRDVSRFYASELTRLDQRLADIQADANRKLTAPMRRLRSWFGGPSASAPEDMGSSLELLRRSRWFDADWYVLQYHDVAASGLAPEAHYLARGAAEARNPSPEFDTRHYLACNPDVADSGLNPLLHFIRHGEGEGRSPVPEPERDS